MAQAAQLPYVLAGMVLMTLQPLFVKMSQNAEGRAEYSTSSAVLLMELLKIAISSCMFVSDAKRPALRLDPMEVMEYAVPALVYFANNNITFTILTHLDAATFQLLGQLKTVFTALLFRIVLGRRLSYYQYLAIWQLACGSAVSQIPRPDSGKLGADNRSSFYGFLLAAFSCSLSAFGGIYNEKLLKDRQKDSIHWQNILLYAWGIVFNLVTVLARGDMMSLNNFFAGYNAWTCAVVLNNALNGLAISAILKYADNIARVYASAAAMLLTMVLSVTFFGENLAPQLLLAILVVSASAVQYNVRPEQLGFEEDFGSRPTAASVELVATAQTIGGTPKPKEDCFRQQGLPSIGRRRCMRTASEGT